MKTLATSLLWAAMVGALLAGCANGNRAKIRTDQQQIMSNLPTSFAAGPDGASQATQANWWQVFDDANLNALIAQLLRQNLTIATAKAQLAQAQAQSEVSAANRWPSLNLQIGRTDSERDAPQNSAPAGQAVANTQESSHSYSADLTARWNSDLFGSLSAQQAAANANAQASYQRLSDTTNRMIADLIKQYSDLQILAQRIALARQTLAIQNSNLQIAQWRAQAGLISGSDLAQAQALAAQTASTIPQLLRSEQVARNRIAILLGQSPGPKSNSSISISEQPLDAQSLVIALGVPADLLRQRPDIRAAELQLLAAYAQLDSAQADLWPQLNLSGTVSSLTSHLDQLGSSLNQSLVLSLAQTLFDGGRRRAQINTRAFAAEEALLKYRANVLSAIEDVENGWQAKLSAQARAQSLAEQVRAYKQILSNARASFSAGLVDYRNLSEAERNALNAQDNALQLQAEQVGIAVQLYLALGQGWAGESWAGSSSAAVTQEQQN